MAITKFADRCQQPSTTTGTGALTLSAADTGFFALSSVYAVNEEIPYAIEGRDAAGVLTGEVEVGRGHLNLSGQLVRDAVFRSSNGNALVAFTSHTLRVMVVASATALAEYVDGKVALSYGTPTGLTVGGSNAAGSSTNVARADHVHELPAPAAPVAVTRAVASAGVATAPARADHKHDVSTGAPSTLNAGGANTEGTSTALARADHVHELAASEAPAAVTRAAAVTGTSSNVARADHKHDVSTGAPGTTTIGATAAEGTSTALARADHTHAMGTPGAPVDVTKAAAAAGSSTTPARADHKHDVSTAAPSVGVGGGNSEGTSTALARADHDHALRTGTTDLSVGTINDGQGVARSGLSLIGVDLLSLTSSAPANVTRATAAVGVASTAARADHKHDVATAAPGAVAIGDAAAEGTSTALARADHVHSLGAPSAPADVTKAAASAGVATTAARADHKHNVSTAAPGTQTVGAAATEGTSTALARADHVHALPAPAAPANVTKATAAAGTSTNVAREDHKHDVTTAAPNSWAFGTTNTEGTSTALARADHVHAVGTPSAPADVTKAAASAGSATAPARADHKHDVSTAAASGLSANSLSAEGTSTALARADHTHALSTAAPSQGIGGGNAAGSSASFARADHDHTLRTGSTDLTIGAIADGEGVVRSGTSLVGATLLTKAVIATKDPVDVATTTNGALATAFAAGQTVDGVVLTLGMRILLKDQTDSTQNGIHTVNASGAPTRASDMPAFNTDAIAGCLVPVRGGTLNASSVWLLTGPATIQVGTHALIFTCVASPFVATAPSTAQAGATASAGTSLAKARADHVHAVSTAASSGAVAIGAVAAEGASAALARADHVHPVAAPSTPVAVDAAAASAGAATAPARGDHKHSITTAAPTTGVGGGNAEGTSTAVARADHNHALRSGAVDLTLGTINDGEAVVRSGLTLVGATPLTVTSTAPANVTRAAANVGVATQAARADHKHDVSTAAPGAVAIGDIAAEGSSASLARADHVHSLGAPSAPADVTKAAASAGIATVPARADHKHDVSTAAPSVTLNLGSSNSEGTSTALARADHVHSFTAPPAPVNVTKAAASAGVDNAMARADHKHDVATATAGLLSVGSAAAEGTSTSLARADHVHALTAPAAPVNVTKAAASAGSSTNVAREDHKHDISTATAVSLSATTTNGEGTSTAVARADHTHAIGSAIPVDTGTANALGSSASFARADHVHNVPFASVAAALAAATSAVSVNSQRLSSVGAGTTSTDAVNYSQLLGLGVLAPVRLVATTAITLSGIGGTVDGKATAGGDRVLATAQADAKTNGIYVVNAGAWARATDADTTALLNAINVVRVLDGSTGAKSFWTLDRATAITLGVDNLSFIPVAIDVTGSTPTTVSKVSANAGSSLFAARLDHVHAVATAAPSAALTATGTNSEGASTSLARADHVHALSTAAPSTLAAGGTNTVGTSSSLARADHVHALPAYGSAANTICQGNDARLSDDRTTNGFRGPSGVAALVTSIAAADGMVMQASSSTVASWSYPAATVDALKTPPGFQAGTLSNTISLLAGSTRAIYLGRVPDRGAGSWFSRIHAWWRVTTAAAGTITFCEIGLGVSNDTGVSTYLTGTNVNITRIMSTTNNALYNAVGVKNSLLDFTNSSLVPGQDLWLLMCASATTAPALRGGLPDDLGIGFHRTAAVRLSTMAADTAFAVASTSDPVPYVAVSYGYPP